MFEKVVRVIKRTPLIGAMLLAAREMVDNSSAFSTSGQYWDDRYRRGGNSGAGSYNRLAEFKSRIVNELVKRTKSKSVIEFGCGDGAQLVLAAYPSYVGVDVSVTAVEMCRKRFAGDASKSFFVNSELPSVATADLAISLDVIYHLIEDDVFDSYMRELFARAERFVCIYSSNEDRRWPDKHVRHRKFTDWIEKNCPQWQLKETIRNQYPYSLDDEIGTSYADFYVYSRSS
jgi:SAM-dependent methyltransferase